jgi:DNA modification methylase
LNQKDKKLYRHPTCKPVDILKNFIVNSTNENDSVLDPFMGSGSTGEACLLTNRKFIGIELEEKYFNISKERLEKIKL